MVNAMDEIKRSTMTNNHGQHWLTIALKRNGDGSVLLVSDIHGHFGTVAASDAPEAIADAVESLFDAMAEHVKQASQDAVDDLRLATRLG